MKKIYLSGSSIGLSDSADCPWQDFVKNEWVECIDGTRRPVTDRWPWDTMKKLKEDISQSQGLIAYLDWSYGGRYGGYEMDVEMEYAKKLGKYVVLVCKRDKEPGAHWTERADFVTDNLWEGVKKMLTVLGIPYQD